MRRRRTSFLNKGAGVIVAVIGLILIVKSLPFYLWPLLLGILLIWFGWRLYEVSY